MRTTVLHGWVDRLRAGDVAAADELLRQAGTQLERMAHKMLQRFPKVGRWEDTADVLQNAVMRLLRALQQVRPASVRAFFGLAAAQMRRELIDLARHYQGPQGMGAHYASAARADGSGHAVTPEPAAPDDADELERWSAFHAAVEQLPDAEREVVEMTFYHGFTQPEIAELLAVDERTVRRRWRAACQNLSVSLRGPLPAIQE
jgi:RNA polymerase sigma factor (sigma-70 family)